MATRQNEGMRKGEIMDFRKAATSVHAALEKQKKCREPRLIQFTLHKRGHLSGQMLRGSASVVSSDNRVTVDDLKRASMEAKRRQPDEGGHMFIMFEHRSF